MLAIFFLLMFFVFFCCYDRNFLFNPVFILSSFWYLSVYLLELELSGIVRDISFEGLLIFHLVPFLYLFGYLFFLISSKVNINGYTGCVIHDISPFKFFVFAAICFLSFAVTALVKEIPLFAENKTAAYDGFKLFGLKYFVAANYLVFSLSLYTFFQNRRFVYFGMAIIAFFILIMIMGRMLVIESIFMLVFFYHYCYKKISFYKIFALLVLSVLYFYLTGETRVSSTSQQYIYDISQSDESIPAALLWPYLYLVTSLNNFDYFLSLDYQPLYGASTFQFLFAFTFLKRFLNFNYELEVYVESFNTGTFLEPFYIDFGIVGVLIFVPLLGFVTGYLHSNFLVKRRFSDLIYLSIFAFSSLVAVMANLYIYPPTLFAFIAVFLMRDSVVLVNKKRR